MGTMFVNYEWNTRDGGLRGDFHAEKIYAVQYESDRETLVNDVLRLMKTKDHCTVTFQLFTGYESIDILRVMVDGVGNMSMVFWEYDRPMMQTVISRDISINKREVRKSVEQAIKLFYDNPKNKN